jgi:hypothetical protein
VQKGKKNYISEKTVVVVVGGGELKRKGEKENSNAITPLAKQRARGETSQKKHGFDGEENHPRSQSGAAHPASGSSHIRLWEDPWRAFNADLTSLKKKSLPIRQPLVGVVEGLPAQVFITVEWQCAKPSLVRTAGTAHRWRWRGFNNKHL